MISAGCSIDGARIRKSVMGFRCTAEDGAQVEETVLIGDVKIGANCKIRRAIIDRDVVLAPGFTLGYDKEADMKIVTPDDKNGPQMSPNGIIVIPKGMRLGFDE